MIIIGFSNVVYCIIMPEAPDRHSAYIIPPLECTYQYPYLYHLVIIARYLTNRSGGINYKL